MMETPKQNDKQNYTSPIRLLKNTSQNAYEEEFFKIKTQRLETEIEELKIDNNTLKNKLVDANGVIQVLRERVMVL